MRMTFSLLSVLLIFSQSVAQDSPRKTTSLNGKWQFHRDGSKETKTVTLPTHWETHEGLKFDGIGWYEKTIEVPELAAGRRMLLHFDAVATHATVYWNDVKLGEHLGAWTPFRFDVTEQVNVSGGRQPPEKAGEGVKGNASAKSTQGAHAPRSRKHVIRVRVDEKVGHNTQGFLPIIAPHFGGIWQGVRLIEVPESYFDDLSGSCQYDHVKKVVNIEVPILGAGIKPTGDLAIVLIDGTANVLSKKRFRATRRTSPNEQYLIEIDDADNPKYDTKQKHPWIDNILRIDCDIKDVRLWSPTEVSKLTITLIINPKQKDEDRIDINVPLRTITTKGDQFLLNGQPLSIRGVLNWGYYPPSLAPTPSEEQWRSDLKLIKSWGFNLMKCCLWVPPKRLLEIADEEGVLIWLEYPTWHPKLTPQYQAELLQEYKEFHELDRNHPSVILRSLTCETGPGADIKVIQALYDQCKMMSGGLVVDDSSWIEWNRVFDFYDDHPYGNNHTWVATLDRLKKYIATSKYGVKPLCLGEAIAADTWVPTKPMLEAIAKAKADPKQAWSLDERGYPFWVPGFFDANQNWLERMGRVCGGAVDEGKLHRDSLKYAWMMRKYQMETYRREVPNGGYVVSVIRDFPLASMGLVDYLGQPKWKQDEWKWHGEVKRKDDPWPHSVLHLPAHGDVVKTRKLSVELLDQIEAGAKVFLQSDGSPGSFPQRAHWFLRGGPFLNHSHPLADGWLARAVEHQHFSLAHEVIPDVNYLEEIDPILMLWDNHDIKEVKTHGLVFETRIGKGRLFVSSLRHDGMNNGIPNMLGTLLENTFLHHLQNSQPPRNALKPETIARMRAKLNEKKIDLVTKSWQFMPDGKNEGLKLGWDKPGFDDKSWKPIKIGQHWEGQGYPTLDGWAWYRLTVEVPKEWDRAGFYINTEGVDDAYELFVNGIKIGEGGDIPNKKTAFEERKAHKIPALVFKPGEKNVIAVRVYDWYGAGGIHRPMTLGNVPIGLGGADVLK